MSNTVIHGNGGRSLTSGNRNTLIGNNTVPSLTTASNNTVVGYGAGTALITGNYSVILGSESGASLSTAHECILIGRNSGNSLGGSATGIFVLRGLDYDLMVGDFSAKNIQTPTIIPETDGTFTLGTESQKWDIGYIDSYIEMDKLAVAPTGMGTNSARFYISSSSNTPHCIVDTGGVEIDYDIASDSGASLQIATTGTGSFITIGRNGSTFEFRSISAGAGITLNVTANNIEISSSGSTGTSNMTTQIITSGTTNVFLSAGTYLEISGAGGGGGGGKRTFNLGGAGGGSAGSAVELPYFTLTGVTLTVSIGAGGIGASGVGGGSTDGGDGGDTIILFGDATGSPQLILRGGFGGNDTSPGDGGNVRIGGVGGTVTIVAIGGTNGLPSGTITVGPLLYQPTKLFGGAGGASGSRTGGAAGNWSSGRSNRGGGGGSTPFGPGGLGSVSPTINGYIGGGPGAGGGGAGGTVSQAGSGADGFVMLRWISA